MIESFIISFKLKNTYRVNTIIYSLSQIPIINKLISSELYKDKALKIIGNIISILIEIGSFFIGKLLYILFMISMALEFYNTPSANTFIHIFVFLTLCGGFLNTIMFNPSKDKYYAMIVMNMDAKKYTLSNYYYSVIKTIVGFLPFTIIFGLASKVPLWICLILPIFVVMTKMIFNSYSLYDYKKNKKIKNENSLSKLMWLLVIILLAIGYGLPLIDIVINELIFSIILIITLVLGIISTIKINQFTLYKKIYNEVLVENNIIIMNKKTSTDMLKETVEKQIEFSDKQASDKTGYAYFHELFVKRHRKILTASAKKQFVIIFLILVGAILGVILNNELKKGMNSILLTYLPYFVYVMFLLNRGPVVTQAMFINCDHSMLTYQFFRTPKVILGLFKERLKSLIVINLIPSTVIAIGLPLLLWLTGGTNNILNYVVLFSTIISMSIFFSVHYLVMYYLLQPYNEQTEIKSGTYKLVQTFTYVICYMMIQFRLPTLYFGACMTLFSIMYIIISLYVVYKYAPKTFKIRN